MSWDAARKAIKARDSALTFGFGKSATPGLFTIEARLDWLCAPVGCVWYRFTDNGTVINIANSFVFEHVRRCGLRTYLHEKLLECFPSVVRITTDGATASGEAWLKAAGFRHVGAAGWEYVRPVAKKRRAKKARAR